MDEILAREIVISVNRMHESLATYHADRSRGHLESTGLLECATTGCALLSNDIYVQALAEDARTGQGRLWSNRRDVQEITGHTHFENFLRVERRLLEEAGMDPGVAGALIGQCRVTRKVTRRGKFDTDAFNSSLAELRLAVCGILAELREATFDQPAQRQTFRRLMSIFKGTCGCAVVGLDASSLARTVGLTEAGSAVSIAVGGAIVGQAVTELSGTGCSPAIWLLPMRGRRAGIRS